VNVEVVKKTTLLNAVVVVTAKRSKPHFRYVSRLADFVTEVSHPSTCCR
jgi:hypothetical protein